MNIQIIQSETGASIELAEQFDASNEFVLHKQMEELFEKGVRRFSFDLKDLYYIGSVGIKVFLHWWKKLIKMMVCSKLQTFSQDRCIQSYPFDPTFAYQKIHNLG